MKTVINPSYDFLSGFIHSVAMRFETEGEVIYSGRNILKRFEVEGTSLVVKSFKRPHIVNKIAYTFFRKSKACRSYEHGMEILKRGGCTPAPIAYIEEYKGGLINRSFYICLYFDEAETIRPYVDGVKRDTDNILKSFAHFTADLHKQGILHIDFSPGNILFEKDSNGNYQFSLIDINRLCFRELSKKEAYQNFSRLSFTEAISTELACWYAEYRDWNKEEAVKEINRYSDDFFLKYTFRLVGKRLKEEKGLFFTLFGPLQIYLFLRWIRTHFLKGAKSGCIYEKERELYFHYIKEMDIRKVLERSRCYE